jgi:hypothetical protein
MLQLFNEDDGGVEVGVGRERKRNEKEEEKEENERENDRLLIIKYSYMCEHCIVHRCPSNVFWIWSKESDGGAFFQFCYLL